MVPSPKGVHDLKKNKTEVTSKIATQWDAILRIRGTIALPLRNISTTPLTSTPLIACKTPGWRGGKDLEQ